MASSSTKLDLFSCLFLLFVCLVTFSDNVVAGESNKVKLHLYYESLCPYSKNFIVNDLVKVINSDLHTITDLKLFPFGNARVSDNLTVTCQHGEKECKLNAIEACSIRTLPDQKLHYGFIRCVEMDTNDWRSCAKNSGNKKAVKDCYYGDLSKKLILGYGRKTMSLKPKKKYVPWVTVNGRPLYDQYDDFVAEVCKAYKGKAPLPKLCNSSTSSERKVSKLQVSFVDETINY